MIGIVKLGVLSGEQTPAWENPMQQMLHFHEKIGPPAMPVVSGNGLPNLPIQKLQGSPRFVCKNNGSL
jgi:hypothetical protein